MRDALALLSSGQRDTPENVIMMYHYHYYSRSKGRQTTTGMYARTSCRYEMHPASPRANGLTNKSCHVCVSCRT
jgi:hypothetical protein